MPGIASLVALALGAAAPAAPAPPDHLPPLLDNGPALQRFQEIVRPGRPQRRRCYVGRTLCGVRCVQFVRQGTNPRECDRYPPTMPRVIPVR